MDLKITQQALAGVAQLVGVLSHKRRVAGSIPGQGTYLGCESSPWFGHGQSPIPAHMGSNRLMLLNHTDVLFLFLSQKQWKIVLGWGWKIKKIKIIKDYPARCQGLGWGGRVWADVESSENVQIVTQRLVNAIGRKFRDCDSGMVGDTRGEQFTCGSRDNT